MGDDENRSRSGVPPPMTAEQILQDLKNAPRGDVVFTTLPKGKEVEKEEVDRVAADCVHMVEAHDKLKNVHQHELPEIVDKVRKQIADLQNFLSVNQTEHKK